MQELPPQERRSNFEEVNCGYDPDMAKLEADRCLFCKKPLCVQGCPVAIDIPQFIKKIGEGDMPGAYQVLRASNPLPAVCGRVCPQEIQCEEKCVVGRKGDPVAIGHLERFVGDWAIQNGLKERETIARIGKKAAIVGSGPAGIACAHDLARAGFEVTIFEALHEAGGVLSYGIPPFRLSRAVIQEEIEALLRMGVHIEFNKVIGKIFSIEQLLAEKGYDAVFIGTGAGLPKFMGIPGEHLNGVMSANEFLTRVNLMDGFQRADTPVGMGTHVAVIGAGNTALDTARTALRMGAEEVSIVYRRTEKESPARVEELRHATEEGIVFRWLTNPVRLLGDEKGSVVEMECVRMELGEPDESGRRSPRPVPGSEFRFKADTVVYGLGTVTNPIISRSTPGLKTNKWGYLEVDPETQMTSMPGVFAGGDIVTGSATVILALGAGRRAARGILKYLGLAKEEVKDGVAVPQVSSAG
ncbi:MAG TPA: NADPH-dependent glutamate synthase [bacterium]|nr:NADPH-dependent glutamate synthase [bacterium]